MEAWKEYAIYWTHPKDIAGSYTEYGTNHDRAQQMLALSLFNGGEIHQRTVTRSDWKRL